MCSDDERCLLSQCVSHNEICEVRVELPVEVFSRLSQMSVASGLSIEQLVAQEVKKLAE